MSNAKFGEVDDKNTIMDSSIIDDTEDESDELFSGNGLYIFICV